MSGDDRDGPTDDADSSAPQDADGGSETAEDPPATGEPTESEESLTLTYVAPFLGVMLIVAGLPLSIVGGYVVIQDSMGLCGDPSIEVRHLEAGEEPGATVADLEYDDLTAAEREAIREATDSPLEEGTIDGDRLEHREELLEGAVVEVDGERYYVRIASLNSCLEVEPLLFPIGSIAILVGIAGVLTPPIYRKLAGFEERIQRDHGR